MQIDEIRIGLRVKYFNHPETWGGKNPEPEGWRGWKHGEVTESSIWCASDGESAIPYVAILLKDGSKKYMTESQYNTELFSE